MHKYKHNMILSDFFYELSLNLIKNVGMQWNVKQIQTKFLITVLSVSQFISKIKNLFLFNQIQHLVE